MKHKKQMQKLHIEILWCHDECEKYLAFRNERDEML